MVSTISSRILLQPIAPLLLPPLMITALQSVVPLGTIANVVAQTAFVAGVSGVALPFAIAVFPQEIQIPTSALEPEFQDAKDGAGQPIDYVLCNKGL